MPLLPPPILMQLPLAEAGQLILVIGIAFAFITLVISTARFHKMIHFGEDKLFTVGDCNDFFFIQVTRYLSKINRDSSGFLIFVIQIQTDQEEKRPVQEQMLQGVRDIIRRDFDKACLFREDCIGILVDTEEDYTDVMIARMTSELQCVVKNMPTVSAFRGGCSSFPLHGLHSQIVIDVAIETLEQTAFGSTRPIQFAPEPEEEKEEQEASTEAPTEEIGELSRKDKNASIDPLTGVIKPAAVGSYFRKYMLEIRRKRGPAAVLCIGINRIEHITSLHGEEATDVVIAEVSKLIQKLTRNCDLIGRYHRGDFLVLATCTLEQGEMIGLRIRDAVQKKVFTFDGKAIKTSVAVGVSGHPEHGKNLRDLFRGAHGTLEIVREWNTSSCLVYDPAQHEEKIKNEKPA